MRTTVSVACLLVALVALGATAHAGSKSRRQAFEWSGPVDGTLRLRDLSGAITVERTAGPAVKVTAEVRWRRSDPSAIQIVRRTGAGGTTFCALWPASDRRCEADGTYEHGRVDSNDLEVHFHVRVPEGTPLDLATTNGSVITRVPSRSLAATTVNGSIHAAVSGPARLRSTNGSVEVRGASGDLDVSTTNGSIDLDLDRPPSRGAISLSTTNGSIEVVGRQPLDADVDASALTGRLWIDGRRYRRHARARLGRGGLRVQAQTINGQVRVRSR
jgi:hypothetical protein